MKRKFMFPEVLNRNTFLYRTKKILIFFKDKHGFSDWLSKSTPGVLGFIFS